MDVLDFFTHLRGDDGQWSGWERDELSRLKAASAGVLENQIWEDGVTDNGDPWIVAVDEESLELSLHVARLSGAYVAVSGDLLPVASSANLKSVVNECLTYIRSNRQETVSTEGTTIRMPIGVSAAAFGIFLTERMAVFDEPSGRDQTTLQQSRLGQDSNESFVFLSSLAAGLKPYADDPMAVITNDEAAWGDDKIGYSAFETDDAGQIILGDSQGSELEEGHVRGAGEVDVAVAATYVAATAELSMLEMANVEQVTEASSLEAAATEAETAQPVDGGEVQIVVVAPANMVVGEDKTDEEAPPDQPDSQADVAVASALPADVEPPSDFVASDPGGDAELTDFAAFEPSPPAPGGEGVEIAVDVWLAADIRDDVFEV